MYLVGLLANIKAGAAVYYHADRLSPRVITGPAGSSVAEQGHFPFGENWYETGGVNKWKFTSYERDSGTNESGNDYAMFRYHVNRLGRFCSPDPDCVPVRAGRTRGGLYTYPAGCI